MPHSISPLQDLDSPETTEVAIQVRPAIRENVSEERTNPHGLQPAPIRTEWILEGDPTARCKILSRSTDDMAFTAMWDCTGGCFNWFYDIDETILILEGTVVVRGLNGERRDLKAGDTFFFASGSRFHWTVPIYVRKIAFIHIPLPPKLRYAKRILKSLKRILRPDTTPEASAALAGR
jgi:uncharacterized protein